VAVCFFLIAFFALLEHFVETYRCNLTSNVDRVIMASSNLLHCER